MATSYQQTDTADTARAACSGLTLVGTTKPFTASVGGTAGTVAQTTTSYPSSGVVNAGVFWAVTPSLSSWASGNYVVRLEVSTANTNIEWNSCYVCQLDSAGTNIATVGSLTGQTISCGTTGVKSMTISGSAITPSTTDILYIVCGFKNTNTMTGQSLVTKSSQLIDTPLTAGQTVNTDPGLASSAQSTTIPNLAAVAALGVATSAQSTTTPTLTAVADSGAVVSAQQAPTVTGGAANQAVNTSPGTTTSAQPQTIPELVIRAPPLGV